jgi:hypothetical protein
MLWASSPQDCGHLMRVSTSSWGILSVRRDRWPLTGTERQEFCGGDLDVAPKNVHHVHNIRPNSGRMSRESPH